jgi:O-antigen ligase
VDAWAWGDLAVLVLLTLVLWAVGCAHCGVLRINWSPFYWPYLAFLILAVVQMRAGWTFDHFATREAVLKIITNFLLFFLAGQLLSAQPENGRASEWFGLIATCLAFGLCGFALGQFYWGNPRVIYGRFPVGAWAFGPYINHNNYAGLMEMLLPLAVAYIFSRPLHLLLRFLLWSGVVIVLISVWMSGSRGAALVLVLEGLVLAGILLWYRPPGVFLRLLPAVVGVVVISAVVFSWMLNTGRATGRAWTVFETGGSLEERVGDRLWVSLDTLRMARSHPWTGVGVGCFEYAFPGYTTKPSDLRWTHAHDDIAEAVAETGLPGAVLLLVALVLFFRMAFGHLEGRLRQRWGWIQMGATVGVVGLLFHSLLDFNLRIPANAAWFVVCLAIATHRPPAQNDARNRAWDLPVQGGLTSERSGRFLV